MRLGRQTAALTVLIALGLAVAGCGRKAPLDSPYQAAIEARKQAIENEEPVPPEPEVPEQDKPFILDPLI